MTIKKTRHGYSRRGRWLEAAVLSTSAMYQLRRIGKVVQQPVEWRDKVVDGRAIKIRVESSVDFIGVFDSVPIAFDAKVTNEASLPMKNVKDHQLEMLESFSECTGVGFLLVCFERADLGKTFACTARWYRQTLAKMSYRQSIPIDAFEHAAADASKECCEVFHGEQGVPVNFGPSARKLRAASNADP